MFLLLLLKAKLSLFSGTHRKYDTSYNSETLLDYSKLHLLVVLLLLLFLYMGLCVSRGMQNFDDQAYARVVFTFMQTLSN